MKKILLFLVLTLFINSAFAYDYSSVVGDSLKDGQSVSYSSKNKEWSRNSDFGDYIFTKYMTKGSGGFSEFYYKQKPYDSSSTYEFFDGHKLIGYNAHMLKFYELSFEDKQIKEKELTLDQVKNYFPDVAIVKISEFKNNKIELTKPWFQKRTFMLLNDTDRDFYKYQFEHSKKYEIIRGIFDVSYPKTFVFSHFGVNNNMFPALKIKVKNSK